jgi:hypothetical protein
MRPLPVVEVMISISSPRYSHPSASRNWKLLITALQKIPPRTKTLSRGSSKEMADASHQNANFKRIEWWNVTSSAAHLLATIVFMWRDGASPPSHVPLMTT